MIPTVALSNTSLYGCELPCWSLPTTSIADPDGHSVARAGGDGLMNVSGDELACCHPSAWESAARSACVLPNTTASIPRTDVSSDFTCVPGRLSMLSSIQL